MHTSPKSPQIIRHKTVIHHTYAYLNIEACVPVILISDIAFHKVTPPRANMRVSLPVGIRHSVLPFCLLIPFFYVLQHTSPWLYICFCPAQIKDKCSQEKSSTMTMYYNSNNDEF